MELCCMRELLLFVLGGNVLCAAPPRAQGGKGLDLSSSLNYIRKKY
jgi:hypothetical protein